MSRRGKMQLSVPRDLYEKIGSKEKTVELIRIGLLSLRTTFLEREIADLNKRIRNSKKSLAELPGETERLDQLLKEAIEDGKILESLLEKEA